MSVLESLGPPPWKNPRNFGKLRRIIRQYEYEVVDEAPELTIAPEYASEPSRAAYFAGEEFSFVKFVGLQGDGMAQGITLDKTHTDFRIPVCLIQGTEDLLAAPEMTKSYYEKLTAPEKKYVKVERSGHDPGRQMLDMQLNILKEGVHATAP